MRRREFMAGLGAALVPFSVNAQQSGKVFRVAHLSGGAEDAMAPNVARFMTTMRQLGYEEGRNLAIASRYASGHFETLPQFARELIASGPDVILASTTPAALAAKTATSTTPIVFASVADPLGVGLVTNLARPTGNITGITNLVAELTGKRLELLKQLVPQASKVALILNPDDQNATPQIENARAAAAQLGVELVALIPVRGAADLADVFPAARRAGAQAALRLIDPIESSLVAQTTKLAAEHKMPVVYPFRRSVIAGGLASYGTDLPAQYVQAANYVHKILRGAVAADLPVEQPTKFELIINLKTAKALGIDVPLSLQQRADEVIE
jgi:putative tryptophan/tyrosine transport system substrate-binding protein